MRHLLLLTVCTSWILSVRADQQISMFAAPLFAWSSHGYFSGGLAKHSHVQNLQIHDSLHGILKQLLDGVHTGDVSAFKQLLDGRALHQHRPDVLLAVLGNQLKSSDLKARAMRTTLQPLIHMLDQSASSLTAPYVLHQASSRSHQADSIQQLAADMELQTSVVGCSEGDVGSLREALQAKQQGAHLVVLCTETPQPGLAGTPEAVAAELQQLQEAHDTVAQMGKHQLTIFAAVPEAADATQARRRLQGVQADVGTCGQLCQTQVKWLEGILATLILAIAAFSGMCCLSMLDTPTRFEKPKEGVRNE